MDIIELKQKNQEDGDSLLVFDDLLAGLLSGEFYAVVANGFYASRLISLQQLLNEYRFPAVDGTPDTRITNFLRGYPKLYNQICFYNEPPVII